MTPARYQRLKDVLDRRQPDLTVLLDNIHKPHNFAAIIRSADAVGIPQVHGVWTSAKLKPGNHTSGGSRKWVQVHDSSKLGRSRFPSARRGLHRLCGPFVRKRHRLQRGRLHTALRPYCLGAELEGLSAEGIAVADQHVVIPMEGMVQSAET